MWRLVTPFLFIGKPSFKVLIEIVWVVTYGKQLEQGVFQFSTADFVSVGATCLPAWACSLCSMNFGAACMNAPLVLAGWTHCLYALPLTGDGSAPTCISSQ